MKPLRIFLLLCSTLFFASCGTTTQQISDSGLTKASVTVPTDPSTGLSIEQWNVAERTKRDNKPGSIKHFYVISSFSGECLMYSTVRGKVTSSNKRLSPKTVNSDAGVSRVGTVGNYVNLNGHTYITDETLDENGTYGESMPYLYWFDTKGMYNQLFPSSGMMLFISETPLNIKSVGINLELNNWKEPGDTTPIKKE